MKQFIVLFLCLSVIPLSVSAGPSREKLLAAYIFRIAEHVHWSNASQIDTFHIYIVDSNRSVAGHLKGISSIKRLHEKTFKVTRGEGDDIPDNIDLIFISQNHIAQYQKIFDQTNNRNILLISENLNDQRYSLIDLQESRDNRLFFKLNKANILNRNLSVNPDIILIGGSEIDVARLYKEGQRNLKLQNEELNGLKQAISLHKEEEEALKQRLSTANSRIALYKKETDKQQIHVMGLQKQAQEQANIILNNNQIIKQRELAFQQLQNEINKGVKTLTDQNARIQLQEDRINHQIESIRKQKQISEEQLVTITNQKYYLFLLGLVGALSLLLFVVILFGYWMKKKSNQLLVQYMLDLATAKKAAEETAQAKSIFLSNMSHELRSPLTSIIGFSQLLKNCEEIHDRAKEYIVLINSAGEHLLSLINDILDMSKIEYGQIELNKDVFNLNDLLHEVIDTARIHTDKKDLRLLLEVDSGCPRYINADISKIRRILFNLIHNAVKFTFEGGISIRFKCENCDYPNEIRLIGEIEDSGIGIEKDQLDRIFLPFEQVQIKANEGKSWQQGTGLGLGLCKQLLGGMKGTINVESTVGKGSVFRFDLCVEKFQGSPPQSRDLGLKTVIGLAPSQPTLNVLIVEDIVESALYLQRVLEVCQCNTKTVVTGLEAVKQFQREPIDIIWMDRRLPEMDGVEAVRMIRSLPGGDKVKIVAITASAFKEDQEEIMRNGFDGFIRKPYLINEIYVCMSELLGLEYQYKESDGENGYDPFAVKNIHIGALLALPDYIRLKLKDSVVKLDVEQTQSVIDMIKSIDPQLAISLNYLVSVYDFSKLKSLIEDI